MSVFLEIAEQYALADGVFADAEQTALDANDNPARDKAVRARQRNDQAYFLYLFTRWEAEVNLSRQTLLAARLIPTAL